MYKQKICRFNEQLIRVGVALKTFESAKSVIPQWRFKDSREVVSKHIEKWAVLRDANKQLIEFNCMDHDCFDELCEYMAAELSKLESTDCSIGWLRDRYAVIAERGRESEGFELTKCLFLLDELEKIGNIIKALDAGIEVNPWKTYAECQG